MERIGVFNYRKMDEASAREIVKWRYEPPYDFYDCDPAKVEEVVGWYLDPKNHYFTVWDEAGELIGFRCFGEDARVPGGDYREEALDMGGGLRPDKTGQGLGASFMESAFEFARQHYAPKAFRATVAAFNRRALRVCAKVGYRQVGTFEASHSGKPFIILVREIERPK
jgi:RimJ/RimL family protein N-acetyltransferase